MKVSWKIIVPVLVWVLITCSLFAIMFVNILIVRPSHREGEAVVEINRGDTTSLIADKLIEAGVINSWYLFKLEARLSGAKIKAGEYSIPLKLSIRDVIAFLDKGKTLLHKVTIREGLTIPEIAAALEESNMVAANDFMDAVAQLAQSNKWAIPAKTLEGYLFPETYNFRKGVKADSVAREMVNTFYKQVATVAPEELMKNPEALHEVVTLASIIEKETGAEHERKVISAVFTNRLKKNMLLQSDPTVIYALPKFDGNIRKKDLSYDSPYNTYKYAGLPPGPIASPGLGSLDAALNPASESYLYFVSKNNGEHYFSRTLREHNNAVRKYQLNKRSRNRNRGS